MVTLASYLSRNWLSMAHINQQLDLLRQELSWAGKWGYNILGPDFFPKLQWLYQDHTVNPYPDSGNRFIHEIGNNLSNSTHMGLCGVANVNDNHWVGIVINLTECKIKFSDSLGGSGTELRAAIQWWIQIHTGFDFEDTDLNLTTQSDGVNCGLFALNAIKHFTYPDKKLLLRQSTSVAPYDEDRLLRFLSISNQDLELVSLLLHYLLW